MAKKAKLDKATLIIETTEGNRVFRREYEVEPVLAGKLAGLPDEDPQEEGHMWRKGRQLMSSNLPSQAKAPAKVPAKNVPAPAAKAPAPAVKAPAPAVKAPAPATTGTVDAAKATVKAANETVKATSADSAKGTPS